MDGRPLTSKRPREKVAAVERSAVDGNEVDFTRQVRRANVSRRRKPRRSKGDFDERLRLVQSAPLALNAQNVIADLEPQVIAPVFDDRSKHGYAELGRCGGDLHLGDGALAVGVHVERMFAVPPDGPATERARGQIRCSALLTLCHADGDDHHDREQHRNQRQQHLVGQRLAPPPLDVLVDPSRSVQVHSPPDRPIPPSAPAPRPRAAPGGSTRAPRA
jgi:hypothetical protein